MGAAGGGFWFAGGGGGADGGFGFHGLGQAGWLVVADGAVGLEAAGADRAIAGHGGAGLVEGGIFVGRFAAGGAGAWGAAWEPGIPALEGRGRSADQGGDGGGEGRSGVGFADDVHVAEAFGQG